MVVSMTTKTITLTWEQPESTGGRNRKELVYNIWYKLDSGNLVMASSVNVTRGQITSELTIKHTQTHNFLSVSSLGLVLGMSYEVLVSAETQITNQIPTERLEDRSVSINVMTNPEIFISTVSTATIAVSVVCVMVAAALLTLIVISVRHYYKNRTGAQAENNVMNELYSFDEHPTATAGMSASNRPEEPSDELVTLSSSYTHDQLSLEEYLRENWLGLEPRHSYINDSYVNHSTHFELQENPSYVVF